MLKLLDAGALATIQDKGRLGYQGLGVPVSGAMDIFSFSAANALVHNDPSAAAIEMHSPVTLETLAPALVALTGAEAAFRINGRAMPQWTAIFVRAGSLIEINPAHAGGWRYLAIHGGIDVPLVLSSRSTFLRGKFGGWRGRALESGDEIIIGAQSISDYAMAAGLSIDAPARNFFDRADAAKGNKIIRIILGPHSEWFKTEAIESLLYQEYFLSASADRMGYRLRGAALVRHRVEELVSCGVPLGAMQVPTDGQPIVLMADHQTTGGYPIIGTIIGADVPLIAQCVEGDAIRFRVVEIDEAERAWGAMWELLEGKS